MCIFYRICEHVCFHEGTGKDTPTARKREGEKRHKKCLGEHFPQLEVIIKTAGAVFTALLLGLHFVCQADSRATPAVTMMCACVRARMQECNPVPYLVPVSNLADLPHMQVFIIDGSPGCLLRH